jgi:medium-chain acyl-[acyl-carrier-protein] hydrolase
MRLDNPWLNVYQLRPQARVTLVCFPHAGSSAAAFGSWAERMPDAIEVAAVEYPGRGSRRAERPFVRLPALVAAAFASMRADLDRPFAVVGHSMGALIAFELARQLTWRGGPEPLGVVVAGCRAPRIPPHKPPIFALPTDALIDELRALNGTDAAVLADPAVLELFLPTLRADFELADTYSYRPGAPCGFAILALGGRDDHETPPADLSDWALETNRPLATRTYPGDHFFIRTAEPQVVNDIAQDVLALARDRALSSSARRGGET